MSDGAEHPVEATVSHLCVDPQLGHFAFIRLVPRGTTMPADTIEATSCSVDVDDDGNPIGVTFTWGGPE